MKARLIVDENGNWLLFADGSMLPATKCEIQNMLFNFKTLLQRFIPSEKNQIYCWNNEYPDVQSVPGETLAYITDAAELVIVNSAPFIPLFDDVHYSIEDMETASDYAKRHRKSVEQIKVLCRAGRIHGATKIGRDWVIPKDTPYPFDHRSY